MGVEISEALRQAATGRTSFLIAHRLSTVMHCDRIYVMESGRVVESGTHDELLEREGGTYARMWSLQQERRDDFDYVDGSDESLYSDDVHLHDQEAKRVTDGTIRREGR